MYFAKVPRNQALFTSLDNRWCELDAWKFATLIEGANAPGQLVGVYADISLEVHGFVATPNKTLAAVSSRP
jgi:hypothetical protein